jgi:hypothetical protein
VTMISGVSSVFENKGFICLLFELIPIDLLNIFQLYIPGLSNHSE